MPGSIVMVPDADNGVVAIDMSRPAKPNRNLIAVETLVALGTLLQAAHQALKSANQVGFHRGPA